MADNEVEHLSIDPTAPTGRIYVCDEKDFRSERRHFKVGDREVSIIRLRGTYYAIDMRCYHSGGPLTQGQIMDIEELGGRLCIACPWHGYKVNLLSIPRAFFFFFFFFGMFSKDFGTFFRECGLV